MMATLLIGEVARRAGLRPSTLRYYESIGLLPEPLRVNGRRHYDPGILARLAVIRFARQAGFRIGEIQELFAGSAMEIPSLARWRALARHKLAELDAQIEQAQQRKRRLEVRLLCDCTRLEECARASATGR